MKVLLVGLGQIGLGLIIPVFQMAGYEIIGTDTDVKRLVRLRNGYILKTPGATSEFKFDARRMEDIVGLFDLVITSVGRAHLASVADWLEAKNISAPVLLAENLPDPVSVFPRQIPIVVDRICPRVVMENDGLTAHAEDYYKISVLDSPLTHQLGKMPEVELIGSEADLEVKRKRKMFTVNTAHVTTAVYGQQKGYEYVEESIVDPEIAFTVKAVLSEIGAALGLSREAATILINEILRRFSSPMKDHLSRILNIDKRLSAMRYIEVPLRAIKASGEKAPSLEETYKLLTA